MVDIRIPEAEQIIIRNEYYKRLVRWIDMEKFWTKLGNAKANAMMRYVRINSAFFFLSPVEELLNRSEVFDTIFAKEKNAYEKAKGKKKNHTAYGLFISRMKTIYSAFMQAKDDKSKKNGYWLMEKLDVRVCPYCNRNYTITVDEDDIHVRPEYDHFYPEVLFPALILSFYNLVPSCLQCNHLKRVETLDVNPWVGYEIGKRPTFKVDTSTGDFPADPCILVENINANIEKLGIEELYNEHRDYVKEILDKIQAYNPVTYCAIRKDFQGIVHTEAELERIVWGNYTKEEDLGKRPFAKLTVDILEQYKKYL